MTLEAALTARIGADGELASMLAEDGGWSLRLRSLPAISMQIVSDPRPQHYKGFQRKRRSFVQVDVWGADVASVGSVRDRLIGLLVPASRVGEVGFDRAEVSGARTLGVPEQSGAPTRHRDEVRRASIDFIFLHDA